MVVVVEAVDLCVKVFFTGFHRRTMSFCTESLYYYIYVSVTIQIAQAVVKNTVEKFSDF